MGSGNSYWFRHEYDERGKGGREEMIRDHGAMGYGAWQVMRELLHQEEGSRLVDSEKQRNRLARYLKVDRGWLDGWLNDCVELYDLLVINDGYIRCPEVERSKAVREDFRNKKVENGRKGGAASAKKRKAVGRNNEADGEDNGAVGADMGTGGSGVLENLEQSVAGGKEVGTGATKSASKRKQNQAHNRHDSTYNTSPPTYTDDEIKLCDGWRKKKMPEGVIEKKIKLKRELEDYKDKYEPRLLNDFWYYWTEYDSKTGLTRRDGEKFFDIPARLRTFRKFEFKQN